MSNYKATDAQLHRLAIADARNDYAHNDEKRCNARHPDYWWECYRDRGHFDGAHPVGVHVSFDTDHYEDWKVGLKGHNYYNQEIMDFLKDVQIIEQFSTLRDLAHRAKSLHESLTFEEFAS